jgi:lipid-A-disaccharide synthase-like uncharacterized protein
VQRRLVLRTHYQVKEPAYLEFLIRNCTLAVQSSYAEVVAKKLEREIERRGKEFNVNAGLYAVDLARALDLLTPNHTWTDKGYLVDLIAEVDEKELEEELTLTLPERLLHFRLFLEGDGAVLLFIARHLVQHGEFSHSDATANIFAQEMFVSILSEYLLLATVTADRISIRREIERISRKPYDGNTGRHKLLIHFQTLYRLDLVTCHDTAPGTMYQMPDPSNTHRNGLAYFAREIPDVLALEKIIATHSWVDIAANVFQIPSVQWDATAETQRLKTLSLIATLYQRVASRGAPLCSLSTLIEATQVTLLAQQAQLLTYAEALRLLTDEQKRLPKDVRFHVDRRGQPAFVKFSDKWLQMLTGE